MYNGLCCRRDKKKEKLSKSKWVQKQKSQKKGEPKAKPDIVLDAILLRRPRSSGPFSRVSPRFPPPPKKKTTKFQNRERSRAADEDTKDKD
jgi:hypothetical protein